MAGVPLSYFCQSVNHAPQTHAGRGFEYVQTMRAQTNLHTHHVHILRGRLQPQHDAQFKGRDRSLYDPAAVFFIAGHAGVFDSFNDGL